MITNPKEQAVCDKYSAYDENHICRCNECPLGKGNPKGYDFRCKANSHYDRHTKEWEYDTEQIKEQTK